jgi:NDP-sugar pyrophosphorylase family protein
MLKPTDFFDLTDYDHADLFRGCEFVWQALPRLAHYLQALLPARKHQILGDVAPGAHLVAGTAIYIGPGAVVEPGAMISGPAYIGPGAQVRHGAYVRSNALIGAGAVVGHDTEIKNSILLPGAHAPHFNYVGDSILGRRVNLGAGTKLSNLTVISVKDQLTGKRPAIMLPIDGTVYDTGLAKLGAIMGDDAQTGCNSVLNPGVLLGPRCLVYPNASLPKGFYPADTIIKLRQKQVRVQRR